MQVALRLPEDAAAIGPAARQLLKLIATSPLWTPGVVARATSYDLRVRCFAGTEVVELSGEALAAPVGEQVRALYAGLFGGPALYALAERFAGAVARLDVLRVLTQHMLAAADVDASLYILLSGLTSGDGLGFNRAAVFLYDEIRARYVGARAIGPADAKEAHRIWEAIEIEGRTLEDLIADATRRHNQSGLQSRVYGMALGASDGDEIAQAQASRVPLRLEGPPRNPGLAALCGGEPYVLAVVQPREKPLGLIFADNLYSGQAIDDEVMGSLATFLDQTSLVLDNLTLLRHVERLARYDSLTGVLNRREFDARMAIEEMRCLRAGHPCSMLIVDLDNFKAVNDREGHAAGDAVLRATGELLTQTLRAHDLVGRFGGDEFIVLLPETPRHELAKVARRIGKLAWEREISLSIGGAAFPADCEVPSALFSIADRNLLTAKAAGRHRACLGNDEEIVGLVD